jgi:folylpolyglutamate synthase
MSQLGDTLGQIAWHKAGIMKPGRPAFTVPQKQEATEVLFQRAKEIGVKSLKEVPPLSDYGVENLSVGLPGEHQLVNASLAVQLCKTWMEEKGKWPTTLQSELFNTVKTPLPECFWDDNIQKDWFMDK